MFSFRNLFVAGLSLMPVAVLLAQEAAQPAKPPVAREQRIRTEGKNSGHLDKFFVSCLRTDNKGEVTIAQLAVQKATDPEVKAFAQEMVKDHTSFLAKLDRFDQEAPAASTTETTTRTERRQSEAKGREVKPDATDRSEATPRAERKADRKNDSATQPDARPDGVRREGRKEGRSEGRSEVTTSTTVRETAEGNEMMQIKQEIADRCLASAQRELNEKQGKEFDKCFIGMQIGAHMHMVDILSVFNNHASPELQQVIDEGLQTSQQHLEHAKKLAKRLDDSSAATGERRTSEKPVVNPAPADRKNSDKPK